MSNKQQITTPVGRLVAGSLYKAQMNDADGKPRVVKTGANAGQPAPQFYFALAIPKAGETHWGSTAWGKLIWDMGHTSWPAGQAQHPSFAWKITDGDSAIKNRGGAGVAPNSREGYPGHWILSFTSQYAPKIYNANGTEQFVEPERVKLGHYVQVAGTIASNASDQKPGMYLNHQMVAFQAFGPEITTGPDAAAVGFGQGVTLPVGASAAPLGVFAPAAPAAALTPAIPAASAAALPPVPGIASTTSAAPIVPNPAFLQPAVPAMPAPGAMPAAPGRAMTAKAAGFTYEQMIAGNWTDAALLAQGYMTA